MAKSDIPSTEKVSLAHSHFNTDNDGWSTEGDCTMTHSPTDGNPGGCLKAVDGAGGPLYYYLAPAKFLGNKKDAFQLDYDIKWVANNNLAPADREVEIEGGGRVLIHHPGAPPRNMWIHCSVPLHPPGWKNVTTNLPATDEDFRVVLASLTTLKIRGEFAQGGPETGYLDNVVIYGRIAGNPPGPDN